MIEVANPPNGKSQTGLSHRHQSEEDIRDAEIARDRLKDLAEGKDSLISGEELRKQLDSGTLPADGTAPAPVAP